jgi:hypothetical protein
MINKPGKTRNSEESQTLWQDVSLHVKPVKESEKTKEDEGLMNEGESSEKRKEETRDQEYVVVVQEGAVETLPNTRPTHLIDKMSFVLGFGAGSVLTAFILLLL